MPLKLQVIIGSTRPGRVGPSVARWFEGYARKHGGFEVELVDIAEHDLPVFDEPKHPRAQDYAHDHTKRWASRIAGADAYVFVTPEYNYGTTPALLNALNYMVLEWRYKPAGIVSYGGVSGGLRAAEHLKHSLTALRMMALPEGVPIPNVFPQIKDGVFHSNELIDASAKTMLDEMVKWATALKTMR